MKLGNLFLIVGLCLTLGASATFSQTQYETDFQIWNDTQFIVPLTKKKD